MKDYCSTDFERKTFIIKYLINTTTNEIEVFYADGEKDTIPYTVQNEIRLLNRMKKQVNYYEKTKNNIASDIKILKFRKGVVLFAAVLSAAALAYEIETMYLLGYASAFVLPTLSMNALMIAAIKKRYNIIDDRVYELKETIKDYEKNLYYLNNENEFDNDKILRYEVLEDVPPIVQEVALERTKNNLDESVPSININNLDSLTIKDLKKVYDISVNNNNPSLVLKPKRKK